MITLSLLILSGVLGVGFRVLYNCLNSVGKELARIESILHREERRKIMRD